MARYEFHGYSPDALVRDADTGQFTLDPGYKASDGRVLFDVRDNDATFDGDGKRDEIGEDSDQRAIVLDSDGNEIAKGKVYVEEFGYLTGPDGSNIRIDTIEIDGAVVGHVTSDPLMPGASYHYQVGNADDNALNASETRFDHQYYEQNSVACFGTGTMIATQNGEVPVEWLDTSDRVLTRDDGFQPILWIGRTRVPSGYFVQYPDECPIQIAPGTLGPNSPTHTLTVTGDHRVMIRAALAELMFCSAEVFGPAKAWADTGLATRTEPGNSYTLTHILLAAHHVVLAQGAWVESLFTGPETMRRLDRNNQAALQGLLGPDLTSLQTARPCLTRKETVGLLSLLPKSYTIKPLRQQFRRCG